MLTKRQFSLAKAGRAGALMPVARVLSLVCAGICWVTMPAVYAEKWEPPTHECSLEFPDASWTFQDGKAVKGGQIILSAANREQNKTVTVVRYQVARSISMQDPRFVQGLTAGYLQTGSRFLNEGYTNVNGCVAYWFTGERLVKGGKVSILAYALGESGRLYQLVATRRDDSPVNDEELAGILASFHMSVSASLPSNAIPGSDAVANNIGRITGLFWSSSSALEL